MADQEAQINGGDEQKQPLLVSSNVNGDMISKESLSQRVINQTFKSTANLANLLPTGTVLTFQILSPLVTNSGQCNSANKIMTAILVALCGLIGFVLSFSDSFRDASGKVRYGMATFKGLWVIDSSEPPVDAAKFKIKFLDFEHALLAVFVFAAVALLDRNVVSCFYPIQSEEIKQVVSALPVAIGVFSSALFVTFPTTRQGISFPLSSR